MEGVEHQGRSDLWESVTGGVDREVRSVGCRNGTESLTFGGT